MQLEEVGRLIARHAGELTDVACGAVVSKITRSGAPEVSLTDTAFVLMVQGAKRMTVGDQLYEYRAGQCLITSVEIPVTGHFVGVDHARPALGFALTLRPALIAELLLQEPPTRHRTAAGVAITDASPEIIDAVGRMVRLLERPRDRGVLGPLLERELHWLVLTGPLGGAVRQLGLADSTLTRIRQAVGWIRDHLDEPFRVEDLARRARLSPSAFHRGFLAITALSPIQYQKQLRLQEARIRLLTAPADVAAAAHAVGYASASQFSREYRRRFGVPPSADIARLRS